MALTTSDWSGLLSPVRLWQLAARVAGVSAAPSVPGVLAPHVTAGASGLTLTASLTLAVLVLPAPSRVVALAVSLHDALPICVTRRLDSVQLPTSTAVLPAVAVKVCVPSLSTAPTGMALTTSD